LIAFIEGKAKANHIGTSQLAQIVSAYKVLAKNELYDHTIWDVFTKKIVP
jgi:hypothetical protein